MNNCELARNYTSQLFPALASFHGSATTALTHAYVLRAIIPVSGIVPTSEPKYRSFLGDFSKRFNCLRESLIAYGQSRPHSDYWLSAAADDKGDAHEEASTFSAQVLTKCPFVFEKNAHGLIVSANPICTTESMLARFEEVKTGLAEVDCPDLGDLESRMKIQVVKVDKLWKERDEHSPTGSGRYKPKRCPSCDTQGKVQRTAETKRYIECPNPDCLETWSEPKK